MEKNAPFSEYTTPKFSLLERGSRLTPERLQGLLDQTVNTLKGKETDLFQQILFNREAALAWDFPECGRLRKEVAPEQVIRTVEHQAWQEGSMRIPRGLTTQCIELLRARIKRGILEESHASYRNPWFLVSKKDKGLRLINSATKLNGVTIRDAYLPPGADEFSEDFAMCKMLSLLDFFSGYDQITLAKESRDMTTFMTPLGLLRMCTLPQGATNSVAQFMRAITRILFDLVPIICRPYLDDICVRGPTSTYDEEETEPGIRRWVLEHLTNLDKVLVNVELSGCTISARKSQFCQATAVIVGFLCGTSGRRPEEAKIVKITEWTRCDDITEVRSFLGIVGYYRAWIEYFAWIALPLTILLRKDTRWVWGQEQGEALETLKDKVTTAPILISLSFEDGSGEIILMCDASLRGWGAVLMQIIGGKRHPARFESGIWNNAESSYDATKRECRAVLYSIKRLKCHLYGIRFTLETDALVLVHQLNGAADDVPGALVTRWLSYILLFDFTVRYVPGKKNSVADGLSRKPAGLSDLREKEEELDADDVVDAQLNAIFTLREELLIDPEADPLDDGYSAESQRLGRYLLTLQRPDELSAQEFKRLRGKATRFFVKGRKLWKRPREEDHYPTLVVDDREKQKEIVTAYHCESGHKGAKVVADLIKSRYWWSKVWNDVVSAKASCEACQRYDAKRPKELAVPTVPARPMWKVHFDTQHLTKDKGKKYCLEARCDFTGWVEAKPVSHVTVAAMKIFVKGLLARFGMMDCAVVDGGPEMKKDLPMILEDLGIKVTVISAYNPRSNGIVEVGHAAISAALGKLGSNGGWVDRLDQVLLADRTTIRSNHGYTPFYLMYGYEATLPLEVRYPTWRLMDWSKIHIAQDLLDARVRVLGRLEEDITAARKKIASFRRKLAARTDKNNAYRMRKRPLKKGDLVLKYNVPRSIDHSTEAKFTNRWDGPFRIKSISPNKAYTLKTLDGIKLPSTYPGDHIKVFVQDHEGWWVTEGDYRGPWATEIEEEEPEDDGLSLDSEISWWEPSEDEFAAPEYGTEEVPNASTDKDTGEERPFPPRHGPPHHIEVQLPEMDQETRDQYQPFDQV